jgi:hypothetical protein
MTILAKLLKTHRNLSECSWSKTSLAGHLNISTANYIAVFHRMRQRVLPSKHKVKRKLPVDTRVVNESLKESRLGKFVFSPVSRR